MSQPAGNSPDPTQSTPPAEPTGSVPAEPTTPEEAYDFFVNFYDKVDERVTIHKKGSTRSDADTYLNAYLALIVPSADKTQPVSSFGQTVHFPATDYPAMHAAGDAATLVLVLNRPSDGKNERLTIHSASLEARIAGTNKVNTANALLVALAEAFNDSDGRGGFNVSPDSYYKLR